MVYKSNVSGQAMVEAVMAFGVAVVILVALLQLSNRSVGTSGVASRQALATAYVTEGLQWVKQQRTSDSGDGFKGLQEKCGPAVPTCVEYYCLNQLGWYLTCGTDVTIPGTEYDRRLILTGENLDGKFQITATVVASWWETGRQMTAKQAYTFVDR